MLYLSTETFRAVISLDTTIYLSTFFKVKLKCFDYFQRLIVYTKKMLNSDWLRKECSSPVTLVQITNGF